MIQRKQIILNEIAFWKKNKMLPDHYCDFLTSLYTGGDVEGAPLIVEAKQSVLAKEKKATMRKFLIYPVVAIVSLLLLNFLSIDWLAISIGLVLGFLFAFLGIKLGIQKNIAAPLLHVSGALLLLVMSVRISTNYFAGNNDALFIALIINCLFWLLLGIWQKLIYFILAGALGLILVITYSIII